MENVLKSRKIKKFYAINGVIIVCVFFKFFVVNGSGILSE